MSSISGALVAFVPEDFYIELTLKLSMSVLPSFLSSFLPILFYSICILYPNNLPYVRDLSPLPGKTIFPVAKKISLSHIDHSRVRVYI